MSRDTKRPSIRFRTHATSAEIIPVFITSETAGGLFLGGQRHPTPKKTKLVEYFDTWNDAAEAIQSRCRRNIARANQMLRVYTKQEADAYASLQKQAEAFDKLTAQDPETPAP